MFICVANTEQPVWRIALPGALHPSLPPTTSACHKVCLSNSGKWIKGDSWRRTTRTPKPHRPELDITRLRSISPVPSNEVSELWRSLPVVREVQLSGTSSSIEVLVPLAAGPVIIPPLPRDAGETMSENHGLMLADIRRIASAQTAFVDPQFVQLDVKTANLTEKITSSIASNVVVLVQGYQSTSKLLSWNDERVYREVQPRRSRVSVMSQSSFLADTAIQEDIVFSDFMSAADDSTACYQLVEFPSAASSTVPTWLRAVADDLFAQQAVPQFPLPLEGSCRFPDNMYDPREWFTLSHAGAYLPHRPRRAGYVSWMHVHAGIKVVSWKRPRADYRLNLAEATDFLEQYDTANCNRFTTCLIPGDIIICSPTIMFTEFTAEHSIIQGGHFYSYHALHLTEIALSLRLPTFQPVPRSALRSLYRMAIVLGAEGSNSIPLRCLHSLARIVAPLPPSKIRPGAIPCNDRRPYDQVLSTQGSAIHQLVFNAFDAGLEGDRLLASISMRQLLERHQQLLGLLEYDVPMLEWDMACLTGAEPLLLDPLPIDDIIQHLLNSTSQAEGDVDTPQPAPPKPPHFDLDLLSNTDVVAQVQRMIGDAQQPLSSVSRKRPGDKYCDTDIYAEQTAEAAAQDRKRYDTLELEVAQIGHRPWKVGHIITLLDQYERPRHNTRGFRAPVSGPVDLSDIPDTARPLTRERVQIGALESVGAGHVTLNCRIKRTISIGAGRQAQVFCVSISPSPKLAGTIFILKLFYEAHMVPLYQLDTFDASFWRDFDHTSNLAQAEASAYEQLKPLQGKQLPHSYGFFECTFYNGRRAIGHLMEEIQGIRLTDIGKKLQNQAERAALMPLLANALCLLEDQDNEARPRRPTVIIIDFAQATLTHPPDSQRAEIQDGIDLHATVASVLKRPGWVRAWLRPQWDVDPRPAWVQYLFYPWLEDPDGARDQFWIDDYDSEDANDSEP
ncbi:hypothetical protein BKA62DRAFT_776594 [Auriculariales sp. MPI-PUGE-AT-0066]|nr:hypothetical protein BKA62DRAFT_776594 [Auriculariales sp. MPI-PUGE-AT-0066]